MFIQWLREKKGMEVKGEIRPPDSLDRLGEERGAEGRVALLYADGNNVGQLMHQAPSPATYAHISGALSEAIKTALFETLWIVFGRERLKGSLPFEIIALGGDDVVIFVPANKGWKVATLLLEHFERNEKIRKLEKELRERVNLEDRITMSAGLVIADVKYPVRFMFSLAEGLLREAKRKARETDSSTLCHFWLRSPVISEDANTLLRTLKVKQDTYITARPYTLEHANQLENATEALSRILPSRSQRRSLAQALEAGVDVSLNYALYQIARSMKKGRENFDLIQRVFTQIGRLGCCSSPLWFWCQTNENHRVVWRTALLDALELLELNAIPEEGSG